jgi:hypothetical protein
MLGERGGLEMRLAGALWIWIMFAVFGWAGVARADLGPGDIVVIDTDLGAVVRVDPTSGDRTIVSDDNTGAGPQFVEPWGVALESDGQILVADDVLEAVVRVDPTTGDRTIVSDVNTGVGPDFDGPRGIAVVPGLPGAPLLGCHPAVNSSVILRAKGGKVSWKWREGTSGKAAFGNPLERDGTWYFLCVFDQAAEGEVGDVEHSCTRVPPGTGWTEKKGGFRYKSFGDGVKMKINPRIAGGATMPLDQDPGVIVQLINSEGACWESYFDSGATKKNNSGKFKARAR